MPHARDFSIAQRILCELLQNRFFEKLACTELRLDGRLDLDLLARLGVPALARRALRHTERAKSRDRHFLAVAHRFYDRVKDRFHCSLCRHLRSISAAFITASTNPFLFIDDG